MEKKLSCMEFKMTSKYICCLIIFLTSVYAFGQKFDQLGKNTSYGLE